MGNFDGMAVLVTGSSKGIGRETALEFARQGADVAVHYARNEELALKTAYEIEALGRKSVIFQAQFSDIHSHGKSSEQVRNMLKGIENIFGRLDIVVSNAAMTMGRETHEKSLRESSFDMTFDINVKYGLYSLLRESERMLANSGGTFIAISSIITACHERQTENYIMVKSAVENFTAVRADPLLRKGINIKCLQFGPVEGTDSYDYFLENYLTFQWLKENWPRFTVTSSQAARQIVRYCDPSDKWWTHGIVEDLTCGLSKFLFTEDVVIENRALKEELARLSETMFQRHI